MTGATMYRRTLKPPLYSGTPRATSATPFWRHSKKHLQTELRLLDERAACRECYDAEIAFRTRQNPYLAPAAAWPLPAWESLEAAT